MPSFAIQALVFGGIIGGKLLEAGITYRDLQVKVNQFAAALQKLNVQKGDRVAIFLPNCPQFVIAYYAIWI